MKNTVRIKGENINLCVVRNDDEALEKYLEWMNDEEIAPFINRQDRIQQRESMGEWANKKRDFSDKVFNIVTKYGTLIGNCDIKIDERNITGRIGIVIGEKDERNKGYGTEAIKMLLNFGFNECNLHRMDLTLNSENERALKCYKKCGLKVVGTFHEDHFCNGHFVDTLYMEILKDDYLDMDKD